MVPVLVVLTVLWYTIILYTNSILPCVASMNEAAQTVRQLVDVPGVRTSYIDRGRGPALIMVHGVGLNASVWMPQIEAFAGRYRSVAYDTLGHGGSDLPPAGATLADYVAQLAAVLDYLGIARATLVGHSMGSLITILFAIEHGDRVESLIAVNPVYRRSDTQLAAIRDRVRALEEHGLDSTLNEALARWFGDPAEAPATRVEQVRQWIRETDPQGYARAYRVFCEADPWLDGRLNELRAPALFVTGALDPNSTPAMARAMAAEAPLARAAVIDGERHMMAYESPDRFNRIVRRFLAEQPDTHARRAAPGGEG